LGKKSKQARRLIVQVQALYFGFVEPETYTV